MMRHIRHISGDDIRRMRRALGLSKAAFAKLLGVTSGATIASWERRGSMNKRNLRMLAGVYEKLQPLIVAQNRLLRTLDVSKPKQKTTVTDFALAKARRQSEVRKFMVG